MHVINTMGNTKLSIVVVQASTTVQTTKDTMIFGRNINVAPQSTAPTWKNNNTYRKKCQSVIVQE